MDLPVGQVRPLQKSRCDAGMCRARSQGACACRASASASAPLDVRRVKGTVQNPSTVRAQRPGAPVASSPQTLTPHRDRNLV